MSAEFIIKYALYLIRWQTSFIVMYPVMWWFLPKKTPMWLRLVMGNLAGGLTFFWIDGWIFKG